MDWPLVPLGSLLTALESGSRPRGGAVADSRGVPSLGGEHLDSHGGFRFDNLKYVPESYFKEMSQGIIRKWDILLVKDGATTGKVALVRPEFPYPRAAVNEHVFVLRVDGRLACPAYVFYYLLSSRGQAEIHRDHRGATIGGISRGFAAIVRVPLPPLSEQRRIVEILDQADRLRRLRAEADAKVDGILPALFIEMFGDPATNPIGWPTRKIGELCEVVSGATPKTNQEKYWGGDIPWVTPKDLSSLQDWVLESTERTLTKDGFESCSTTMLPKGAVLLSSRAPIGLVAIAGRPVCTNQGFKSLVCGGELDPWYLFAWCRLRVDFLESLGRGATFKEISKRIVQSIDIPVPPLEKQKRFAVLMETLHSLRSRARLCKSRVDRLFEVLVSRAFAGVLTASWREAHMEELLQEMKHQAKAFRSAGL